jgi:hypothetical protein
MHRLRPRCLPMCYCYYHACSRAVFRAPSAPANSPMPTASQLSTVSCPQDPCQQPHPTAAATHTDCKYLFVCCITEPRSKPSPHYPSSCPPPVKCTDSATGWCPATTAHTAPATLHCLPGAHTGRLPGNPHHCSLHSLALLLHRQAKTLRLHTPGGGTCIDHRPPVTVRPAWAGGTCNL